MVTEREFERVSQRTDIDPTLSTAPRVLIIEDDESLVVAIRYALQKRGFQVFTAADGDAGLKLARVLRPDLVLLDLMLPRIHGQEVCRHLRSWTDIPVLMLTALDREGDVVAGLEAGADDYLTKPFGMEELVARARALLRRTASGSSGQEILVSGDLVLMVSAHRAMFHGRELRLPPKEFRLLVTLVRNAGRVYTRDELLDEVWGEDVVVDPRNVDVHIRWLRAQLEGHPDGSWMIQTVHGVGYRFAGEPGPTVQSLNFERDDY